MYIGYKKAKQGNKTKIKTNSETDGKLRLAEQ